MTQKYLKQRDNILHVRKRVPLDLIPLLGRREIHCSLRTSDQRQAKNLARTILTNLETGFLTLRQQRLLNMPEETLREAAQALICDRLPSGPRPRLASVPVPTSAPGANSKCLSELIETFVSDRKSGWEHKTLLMRSASLALFVRIVGDKPVAELTRDECRNFRDTLAKLPSNMSKRFKGLSIAEVVSQSPEPMSVTSVNKYLTTVGAFLNWAVEEKALTENPGRGLKLTNKKHPDTERDAYSPDNLNRLFEQSPLYQGCASERKRHLPGQTIIRDAKWWLPLISLYSGMCLEEIAQLGIQDIRQEQGILCFDVNAGDDRKLKTDYRPRVVPVHPTLIELGFRTLKRIENNSRHRAPRQSNTHFQSFTEW